MAGLLHLPATQHYLAKKVTAALEQSLQTDFSFSSIRFGFFRPLTLEDFLIRDRQEDTLIYVQHLTAYPNLRLSSFQDKSFVISRADIAGAFVRLIVPADTAANYEFLFKRKSATPAATPFYLTLKKAHLLDSRFVLNVQSVKFKPFGVHFTDLDLKNIQGDVKNLEIFNKILTLSARHVSFTDKTGWKVNDLSADMENAPRHLWFDNVTIITPWSDVRAEFYHMDFDSTEDYKDFPEKVHLSGVFKPSVFGYHDFNAVAQTPRLLHNDIRFSGQAHGVLSNLVVTKLKIELEQHTTVDCNVNLVGLPDFRETYLHFNVKRLVSSMNDIAELYQPGTNQKLKIPQNFKKFGKIIYTGKFTGFMNDFVSYGTLTTDIGTFEDDISISTDTSGHVGFNGYLALRDFDIGVFTGNTSLLGKITSHANIHGTVFNDKSFSSRMTGTIDSIEVNRYTYHSIVLDGRFTEKAYDGSLTINDPNLQLNFLGMIDLKKKKLPEFDFSLNILKASLFPLNITKRDTNLVVSGLVLASFKGNGFNDFNGTVKLLDAHMTRKAEELKIYNVQLHAFNSPDSGSLRLTSDYLTAGLQGRYDLRTFPASMKYLLAGYFPGSFSADTTAPPSGNDFTYTVTFKNIESFTRFFLPGYYLAHDSYISGRYAPALRLIRLEAGADEVTTPQLSVDSLHILVNTNGKLSALVESAWLDVPAGFSRGRFTTVLQGGSDTLDTRITWNNPEDSLRQREELHLTTHLQTSGKKRKLHMDILLDSTRLTIRSRLWKIHQSTFTMDSSAINIRNFRMTSGDKALHVNGKISERETDTLTAGFQNLDLFYLNGGNKQKNLVLEGILNGKVALSDLYHNPIFLSTMNIRDFSLNGEPLGDANIRSTWDTVTRSIVVDVHTDYGTRHPVTISGLYTPASKYLQADIVFDKFRLKAFSSFVSAVFSSLNGNVSGRLHADGSLPDPTIRGNLVFQKTSLTVDYLKTTYNFTADVPVRNNHFLMDSIVIFDEQGNTGVVNGYFALDNLLTPALDMTVNTSKLLVLNTTARDNEYFYGRGIASGGVSIRGPLNDLVMNISARSGENTSITLPLSGSTGESIETDFIHFVNHEQAKTGPSHVRHERSVTTSTAHLTFNMDLHVTPDAEITLLFDPSAGGTLYGRGHGDLRMEVHRNGDFNLYGEYIIDEGTYRFTLQKVINKKFRLENGGKITWNGDPLDAHLDILAVYPLKTSLYPLFFDDNYKKRVPVECQILLKGSLNNPKIGFNIELPTVDEDTRSKVRNAMSSEEELSKQFLSLLIINSFPPTPLYNHHSPSFFPTVLGITTTEMLSNQLSSWISQISKDFDVGFSYHPGDEVTSEQVEVALSTQLLNDRISLNGNIDFNTQNGTPTQNTSNIVGDFQVEVKITKNGKLRVKAFTRANDNYLYETAHYTNGIGIFYREEFSAWDKLFKGYWQKLFGKKEEEGNQGKKKNGKRKK